MKVAKQMVAPAIATLTILTGCQQMKTPPAEGTFASDQVFLENTPAL